MAGPQPAAGKCKNTRRVRFFTLDGRKTSRCSLTITLIFVVLSAGDMKEIVLSSYNTVHTVCTAVLH